MTYSQVWDLETIFPGGSGSAELQSRLEFLQLRHAEVKQQFDALTIPDGADSLDAWVAALQSRLELFRVAGEAGSFVGCLMSQDVSDTQAKLIAGRLAQLGASFAGIEIALRERIRQVPDETWSQLLADSRIQPIAFQLQEIREDVDEMLSPDQEALIADLSVDGLQAWGRFYNTLVGRVTIPVDVDGEVKLLSAGQAYNKFDNQDQAYRAKLMTNWEASWGKDAELFATALNHIGGSRLTNYRHHKWESVLARALKGNRMEAATLQAMWTAINAQQAKLVAYFQKKAAMLGVDALHWYDESAPINDASGRMTYDEAAAFIVEQFQAFSPAMADFALQAFEKRWIEAEDRPGKRPGGFCTRLPDSQESRIFMTYGGTTNSAATLAHELGHAYHNHVQWELPAMARGATMSTAETASTFAEIVVAKAATERASTAGEKLALLDESVRRTVTMFMNIQARFLFEVRFHEARKQGLLSVEQLNTLMETAQKEAFGAGLASYHPHFWASKGHFYGTGVPLYNFPYTFGYLFSAGLYARAVAEGPSFAPKYDALLRDTGRMSTEDVAKTHLGVDLTQPKFWEDAVALVMADVDEFLSL